MLQSVGGVEGALVIDVHLQILPAQIQPDAGAAQALALGTVIGLEPAVVQRHARGDLQRPVVAQGRRKVLRQIAPLAADALLTR